MPCMYRHRTYTLVRKPESFACQASTLRSSFGLYCMRLWGRNKVTTVVDSWIYGSRIRSGIQRSDAVLGWFPVLIQPLAELQMRLSCQPPRTPDTMRSAVASPPKGHLLSSHASSWVLCQADQIPSRKSTLLEIPKMDIAGTEPRDRPPLIRTWLPPRPCGNYRVRR